MVYVAVDIGGTFTDVVAVDPATGRYHTVKVSTTPKHLVEGVRAGTLAALERVGAGAGEVSRFVHGTTIGTNAVLERKGAVTGILSTEGFQDTLEIGRLKRTRMYDLNIDAETPVFLAPGRRRLGVTERIAADGSIVTPLDEESVRRAVREFHDQGVTAIAVCLLFGFRNPEHEERVRRLINEVAPEMSVSLSSEVDPMFREYERTVVTAFDAYVRPVIQGYVDELTAELRLIGIDAPLQIMQSRGGITSAELVGRRPVSVLLSGPAAGVIGARYAAALSGIQDVISIDVGGTSADVSLVAAGKPLVSDEGMIDTYPLRVPMVDVTAVGAGGGSIAWIDAGGSFRVGPVSAGADPGPVCYGRGGTQPTVTDASLILGYLNPASFAGGSIALNVDAARAALEGFGRRLGMSGTEAAEGIHRVINSRMADAIRLVSLKRGFDPRDFALLVLGGAGPLHGGRLAAELGIRKIVVPAVPGVLSALGLLVAAVEHDAVETFAERADRTHPTDVAAAFQRLAVRVARLMAADDVPHGEAVTSYSVDGRYAGQAYALEIPVSDFTDGGSLEAFSDAFHKAHQRVYGHANRSSPVELLNLRVVQTWELPSVPLRPSAAHGSRGAASRSAYFAEAGGYVDVPVSRREGLAPGTTLEGPALVDQDDTTIVIYPGHEGFVDAAGNILITADIAPASATTEQETA
ncbi:MAG: hydantoinase/oxoprolinase family protein [Candidatus Dormibacteria bacterium]